MNKQLSKIRWLKPKYVRWRDWLVWILLPRRKKEALDNIMGQLSLLRPLLRNHPDVVKKIRSGEGCSWSLRKKDAADALEAVELYRRINHERTMQNRLGVPTSTRGWVDGQ